MRPIKVLLTALTVYCFFMVIGTSFSSCAKTTVHDTTTVTVHDTTIKNDTTIKIVNDTVTITDTLGNLSDGLVAYYNFNNGSLADSSGNGNDIVFNGATATSDRFGIANNAFQFNGSTSYMQVKNSGSINPSNITLYAIVKVNDFYTGTCYGNEILSKGSPDAINGLYFLRFSPAPNGVNCDPSNNDLTKESFYGTYGDNDPQGSAAGAGDTSYYIQKKHWYTIVYTYDGSVSKFFVNGALVNQETQTITFTPNSDDLIIGKNANTVFPYYFNGAIDEIRIYNKAITNQQVGYLNILKDKFLKYQGKLIY